MADLTQQMGNPINPVAPETNRLQALKNLAANIPVANSRVAAGQQAARDLQLQKAVAAAPAGTGAKAAQGIGEQQAQTAGQQMIQNAQQGIQQTGQVGQLGLAEQARQNQSTAFGEQMGAQQQAMDNTQRLANISEKAKQDLYDKQMQFQKDENGRTVFNAIQMADYAATTAQSQQQYQNYAQQAQDLNQKNLEVMQTAYENVIEDLNNKYEAAKQQGDQDTMREVAQKKHDADVAMQDAKNKAANNSAAWSAGGTIIGAVAGAVIGGPAGAMVGASAGGALGTIAGNTIGAQQ